LGKHYLLMPYINDPGYEIPENTIGYWTSYPDSYIDEVLEPLAGQSKRDWFDPHFYYCLPLVIGNQYGFGIKSAYGFTATMPSEGPITFKFDAGYDGSKQEIKEHFGFGIITFTNRFLLRTPPGINLMTMQPPNFFIPGLAAMTGVVETDNLRMNFTFNVKMTIPNYEVRVNKGDLVAAFMPVKRYEVEKYKVEPLNKIMPLNVLLDENEELKEFTKKRSGEDRQKPHGSGRLYFNGKYALGNKFKDHQLRVSEDKED